jgi:resolvase-like protein/recombinase
MIAAVYARKSTAQDDVAEAAKSVTRQVEGARAFITAKGWTLDEAHIYTDDGVSAALFAHRPDYQRMMRGAAAGAFDALVFFDLDRLGRDGHKTMVALNTLADLGVTMWDSSTGRQIQLDTFENRLPTIFATGQGLRGIARVLNTAKAPSPRAQLGRPNGWSATSVREVLMRPLYRGELVWGRTVSAYGRELGPKSKREAGQIPRPEETWIRRDMPDQRIIDVDLAARVEARRASWQRRIAASKGRCKPQDAHGRFLLSGGPAPVPDLWRALRGRLSTVEERDPRLCLCHPSP